MKRPVHITITIVDAGSLRELGSADMGMQLDDDLLTRVFHDRAQDQYTQDVAALGTEAYRKAFPR